MNDAHFPIHASLDRGGPQDATVNINRKLGLFEVHIKHGASYTLPLTEVARIVVHKMVKADLSRSRVK